MRLKTEINDQITRSANIQVTLSMHYTFIHLSHLTGLVTWREGEGEREGEQMLEFDGLSVLASSVVITLSRSSTPPFNLHPPLPLLAAAGTVSG